MLPQGCLPVACLHVLLGLGAMLQAHNTSMLAQCFYQLEDFASLTKLVEVLTEGQPLLADLGRKLQSVGLCSEAVAAFSKVGVAEWRVAWAPRQTNVQTNRGRGYTDASCSLNAQQQAVNRDLRDHLLHKPCRIPLCCAELWCGVL